MRPEELGERSAIGALEELRRELHERAWLKEHTFTSHVPLIGPLIAWFRATWNSVSTRWYVQPMLQQQGEFNALTARALDEVGRALRMISLQAEENAEAMTDMARGLAEVRWRLDELERRLDRIEARLPPALDDQDGR